jgi:hypothetical protein
MQLPAFIVFSSILSLATDFADAVLCSGLSLLGQSFIVQRQLVLSEGSNCNRNLAFLSIYRHLFVFKRNQVLKALFIDL